MGVPSPATEPHGVRIEADGSIVMERQQAAVPRAYGPERPVPERPLYHVANPALSAVFQSPARISAYQAFGIGPILKPDAWRSTLTVDGQAIAASPDRVRVRGRLLTETWAAAGCRLNVTGFVGDEANAIYQAYQLEGLDDRPHQFQAEIQAGFLADEDQGSYALHLNERYGALVAVFGETALPPEAVGLEEGPGPVVPARSALIGADLAPAEWGTSDQRAYLTYRLDVPPRGQRAFCLVVTGGWSRAEHEALFGQATGEWREALAEAGRHADWLGRRLELDDPGLHSLFAAGLNDAISAYRRDHEGRFSGLVPAPERGFQPPVTLPCDAYWCAQVLLPFHPEAVRDEVVALARAVHDDGRLAARVWAVARAEQSAAHPESGPYDAWPDACDAPSYFALLLHDYVAWTGEQEILDRRDGGASLWEKALACVDHLRRQDTNHDLLFEKRRDQPDWQYDVLRDEWVTYDLALHCQALKSVAELALLRGDAETARDLADWAAGAQRAINQRLWNEGQGYYVDYIRSYQGMVEDHAAVDTVLAVLYGIGTERQCHRHLERLEATLETRNNDEQYYGDWGLMSCFPFYKERSDLVGRSAWAYSFHNGAAWPGWSGIFALAELLHRRPGWRYALERWWTYSLEHSWLTPTEYYAPPYDAPGVRQSAPLYAWSSTPAAAMILGGFGFWPNLAGEVVLRVPPWGDSRLNGVHFRGETYDVEARDGVLSVLQQGDRIASSPHGLRVRLGRAVPVR